MYTTLLILLTFILSWGFCVLYFVLVCVQGCVLIYLQTVSFHTGFLLNSTVNFLVSFFLDWVLPKKCDMNRGFTYAKINGTREKIRLVPPDEKFSLGNHPNFLK
jgi:hypothetical protein